MPASFCISAALSKKNAGVTFNSVAICCRRLALTRSVPVSYLWQFPISDAQCVGKLLYHQAKRPSLRAHTLADALIDRLWTAKLPDFMQR